MLRSYAAVLATAKVPNLKANHNQKYKQKISIRAVLATAKVPNLKANHNYPSALQSSGLLC